MELKDTIELMTSNDYKDRFRAEYWQTKIRFNKLFEAIEEFEAGVLPFLLEPTNIKLLKEQAEVMGHYLYTLEIRASLENIEL